MVSRPLHSEEPIFEPPDSFVTIEPGTENPFPGLRPFTVDECHLYFGREGQVDDILLKLSQNRFVCVMGYSGSGKSSLMYCGLVPVLYGGFVTNTGPHWNIITTRPGTSPIDNLAESAVNFLIESGRIEQSDRKIYKSIFQSVLRSGPSGLADVSKYIQENFNENIFFLIDQFEELFRIHDHTNEEEIFNEQQAYVNLILHAVGQTEVPAYISITMRSDFIARCAVFPKLTDLINQSNYLVPQMSREQKKMVIEGPVAVSGGKISQRLVKRLLSDMGKNQDQLPILQHAMMRTWDYWVSNHEPGEPIDLRHYNAIGKISSALSQHANEAYEELSLREKEIAEVMFKSITEKSQDNRGMRRPSQLSLIAELADASEEEVVRVVDHFRRPGRSFLMPSHTLSLRGSSVIELSHESLMRIWNKLDVWVEEEFESAQMYKRLSDAAAMYQIGKTGLWRPPDLQLALNWQKKQRPTRAWAQRYDEAFERAIVFLDTSRITYEAELKNQEMQQRRMLRRARTTAIILGIAAVVAILFLLFAYLQKIEADTKSIYADEQRRLAIAESEEARKQREEAVKAKEQADEEREKAVQLYNQLQSTLEELTLEKLNTERALTRAQQQEKLATEAGQKESEARFKAEEQTRIATLARDSAQRLFMLTKAQELASKSVQEQDDKNLAALAAKQAYLFHRRYRGKRYDPYIYSGLYHSLKLWSGSGYNAIRVQGPTRNRMNSVAVSSNYNKVYMAAADGRIFVGDFENLTSQPTGYENAYPNKVIALSNDEHYLVNGTDSANVQIFDLTSSSKKPVLVKGLSGATNSIVFMPGQAGFLVSKGDKTINIVNHLTGKVTSSINMPGEVKSMSVSPDGRLVAGGTWDGLLILIELESRKVEVVYQDNTSQILSVKFSPDGKTIAFGTFEKADKRGLVKLFDVQSKTKLPRQFSGHRAGVYDVEFSPDGQLLASAGADKRLQMWVLDFPEDLPIVMDNNNGFIWDIEFAKGSDFLIAACHESEIRVWPTNPDMLAEQVCPKLTRNMTLEEWDKYVGKQIPFENTCPNILINDY